MSTQHAVTPDKIMQLGLGFWGSKTFLSAIELGVFTALSDGPLDAQALQERLQLHPRSTRDFLDALVALGMLERDGTFYSNTPETARFLVRGQPGYLGGMLEMANQRLYPFWGSLTEALHTGLPQNEMKTGGQGLFETIYGDPERLRLFLSAMTGLSMGAAMAIAAKFPWREYKTVVDVGGAQGGLLVQLCLAHQHLKGINFDLPVVGPIFEEHVAMNELSDRLKFVPGSFFETEIPSGDVITMGHILHDWNLEEKRMLLDKAYRALPDGGALIVFEALIDDERRQNAFGLLMSLNMLIETPGGFDYTGADCSAWMREAGFRETRVEHLIGPDSMVVAIK
ncbi:MAG TPA: methyltransferase [Pyrinomonadaceae bacterium]|nr:methyltransferase [Pyrinomonadaceae bacterium]